MDFGAFPGCSHNKGPLEKVATNVHMTQPLNTNRLNPQVVIAYRLNPRNQTVDEERSGPQRGFAAETLGHVSKVALMYETSPFMQPPLMPPFHELSPAEPPPAPATHVRMLLGAWIGNFNESST